jgi:hypothetical protein
VVEYLNAIINVFERASVTNRIVAVIVVEAFAGLLILIACAILMYLKRNKK